MNKGLKEMGVIFFGGVLLLVVFWPLFNGYTFLANGMVYSDLWLFNHPLKDWYRNLLLIGKLPFWTSLLGNGYPVFAEGQIGALYPLNLFFYRFFPTSFAFNLSVFSHYLMAFLFTYLFSRISLKLSKWGSFLAGITFSLSGYFFIHTQYLNVLMVVAYLPLVFLATERLISTGRLLWMFILVIAFSLQILAGYFELFYFTVILAFVFFIFIVYLFPDKETLKKGKKTSKLLILFFAALVMAAGICAVQILSTWEITQHSNRSEGFSFQFASSTPWPLETLAFFVYPGAYDNYQAQIAYNPFDYNVVTPSALYGYIGLVPLILAFLVAIFFHKRFVVIFSLLLLLAFIYGIGRSTQVFMILWEVIPGLKLFRYPVKILFFIEFCLSVLAGLGFDFLKGVVTAKFKTSAGSKYRIGSVVSALVILITLADLYFNNVLKFRETVLVEEWLAKPEAAQLLQEKLRGGNWRYYSHGTNNLYQIPIDIKLQKQFQNILPVDFNLLYRLPSNREYFTLFLQRQQRLNNQRTIIDSEKAQLRLPPQLLKALALQSVRFLLADLPIDDPKLVLRQQFPFSSEVEHRAFLASLGEPKSLVVPAKAAYLYEYEDAYPRASVVSAVQVVGDGEAAFKAILEEDFDPLQKVVLEEPIEEGVKKQSGEGQAEVKILSDEENLVKIELETDTPGFLVLNDTYYPGWRAVVRPLANYGSAQRAAGIASGDARQAKIYRANYAFRAVAVPAGKHLVEFTFEPTYWRLGLGISVGALIVTGLGLGYCLLKRK